MEWYEVCNILSSGSELYQSYSDVYVEGRLLPVPGSEHPITCRSYHVSVRGARLSWPCKKEVKECPYCHTASKCKGHFQ